MTADEEPSPDRKFGRNLRRPISDEDLRNWIELVRLEGNFPAITRLHADGYRCKWERFKRIREDIYAYHALDEPDARSGRVNRDCRPPAPDESITVDQDELKRKGPEIKQSAILGLSAQAQADYRRAWRKLTARQETKER